MTYKCPKCGRNGMEWDGGAKVIRCLYNDCNHIIHMEVPYDKVPTEDQIKEAIRVQLYNKFFEQYATVMSNLDADERMLFHCTRALDCTPGAFAQVAMDMVMPSGVAEVEIEMNIKEGTLPEFVRVRTKDTVDHAIMYLEELQEKLKKKE